MDPVQEKRGISFLSDVKLCSKFIIDFIQNGRGKPYVRTEKHASPGDVVAKFKKRLPHAHEGTQPMETLLSNFNALLMPSLINWKHTQNFGFFPPGNAIPNIFADMLSSSMGGVGFTWTCQPALTELENLMLDWFAKLLYLPDVFSFEKSAKNAGGGSIQNSGTDAIYNTMVAARFRTLLEMGCFGGSMKNLEISATFYGQDKKGIQISHPGKLVRQLCCFASYEAHSSFRKAAKLALLDYILIENPHNHGELNFENLKLAYDSATTNNNKPIYTLISLGTPTGCAFDKLKECAQFCKDTKMWCHVNASYAGNALILHTEFIDQLRAGLEYADSINISPYKMLLCAPDLALLWVKDRATYSIPFVIGAEYLLNVHENSTDVNVIANTIAYKDYGVSLTRRMRALKIFFVLQMYGKRYLIDLVRNKLRAALFVNERLKAKLRILNSVQMGIVVFRQKNPTNPNDTTDDFTLNLLAKIQSTNKVLVTPCHVGKNLAIRLSINDEFASDDDVESACTEILSSIQDKLDDSGSPADKTQLMDFLNRGHLIEVDHDDYKLYQETGFRKYEEDAGPIIISISDRMSRVLSNYL